MKTCIATIATPAGTQTIQLAAANIQEAQSTVEARAQSVDQDNYHYSIRQVTPMQSPEFISGLMNATGALVGCLVFYVVAIYRVRKYFKG